MNNDPQEKKLELTYPRPWEYTVIGPDSSMLLAAIAVIVGRRDHTVTPAHTSRTGKYSSVTLELIVADEADRNAIFTRLGSHDDVKVVL